MLDFEQIRAQYPNELQGYEKSILREYLQYKILQAIFESKYASRLSFLGGTALRIIHGNYRFSEDIDLDNFGLDWDAFADLAGKVAQFLEREGFIVELSSVERGAFHCHIKFPGLLFQQGLSPLQHEKTLIQVDSVSQGYAYKPDLRFLNKFDVFTQVRVTPLSLLLSQKIFTAINRKRAKGRDFYDITFLLSQTKPDYGFIKTKMDIASPELLREVMLEKLVDLDFEALAQDVAPFLIKPEHTQRVVLFREFWKQAELA